MNLELPMSPGFASLTSLPVSSWSSFPVHRHAHCRQFEHPRRYVWQVLLLGLTAMATAAIFDSAYAVLTAHARKLLTPGRVRLVSRLSGGFLIGGGVWLALARGR